VSGRLRRPWLKLLYAATIVFAPWIFWPQVGAWFLHIGQWWLCIFLRAFTVTVLTCPGTIWLARRFKVLDIPDKRKLHGSPMPRLGGLAVLAGVLVTTLRYAPDSVAFATLLAGAAAVYLLALWDDIRSLSAAFRLSMQLLVCLTLILAGVHLTTVPPRVAGEAWLNGALTSFWIIGLLNAVNFLDGIDGLAASLGFVCAALFLAVGWDTRQSYVALLTAATAGACLGFLPYNWHRSATFLGDGGATLIGYLLACTAVFGTWNQRGDSFLHWSTPLLILSIPIFDMIYTTLSRIKNRQVSTVREWLEFVGKDHLHHRLLRLGLSQPRAVVFVVTLNLILGLGALVIRVTSSSVGATLLVAQSVLIFLIITVLMLLARQTVP
jgi:UDP-GlcNAc:undecaprenyl-phosphate/decaprenyl-phosphate GlcNAc-1-phosphate transferase